jgi:two-component sensor histidine kinase
MHSPPTDAEIALAEALHRARNDLQAVASMLRLQASRTPNSEVRAALDDARIRVVALSSLNNRLDAAVRSTESLIDTEALLEGLAADLQAMYFQQRPIALEIRVESHRLGVLQGKPLGFILNELAINALKYAFPNDRAGTVTIEFHIQGDEFVLMVADDGVGIDVVAPPQATGLGHGLVRALASQLHGLFAIEAGESGGTRCIIRWPSHGGSL